jgi:hypothetical protein
MPRGGKRTPPARTPPGGPGQFSRRTDGQQIATPGLAGSPDLQFGDIEKLRGSMKMNPLPAGTPQPRPNPVQRRPTGAPTSQGGIPPHLLDMPPEGPQPMTQGLSVGPGAGPEVLDASTPSPDIRELILESLARRMGNPDASRLLQKLREEKVASAEAPIPPTAPEPTAAPTAPVPPAAPGGMEQPTPGPLEA